MADANLGQDDIDRMLAEMGVGDQAATAPAAVPPAPAPVPEPVPVPVPVAPVPVASVPPAPVEAPGQPVAPGSGSGTLDSTQIEALVAQATVATVKQPASPAAASTASGQLGQDEIDKLLADLDPATRQHAGGNQTGHLSQENIDKLLSELNMPGGGEDSEVVPTTKTRERQMKASGPAAATKTTAKASTVSQKPASASASASGEGPLSQDDVDKLLAQLGATSSPIGAAKIDPVTGAVASASATAAEPPRSTRTVPPAPAPVEAQTRQTELTATLSAEEIERIVAKQNDAPPGHDSEAVIAQSDIDALVKQLATATGSPDGTEVANAIAGKTADIDRIQAEAEAAAGPLPEMTADAVDVNGVLGRTAATSSLAVPTAPITTISGVATVATFEWRAAGWVLIAAVLALAVSVGALIMLTRSVRQLSDEIRAEREIEHPTVDTYAEKLGLALAKLAEADEAECARGVRWMEELKRDNPEHAAEVGVALARNFRSREAWRRAADEYAAALELRGGLAEDPRILLEQADCQARLGDESGAVRTIYALLAGEERWLAERSSDGRPTPERERNRQAVADAYLVLGRLLVRIPTVAARTAAPVREASATAASTSGGGGH